MSGHIVRALPTGASTCVQSSEESRFKQDLRASRDSPCLSLRGFARSSVITVTAHFSNGRVVGTVTSPFINEASGIAASRRHSNILYTHNDSGGRNRIFAVDTTTGHRLATFYIDGAHSHDWEDIAVGPCANNQAESCIYIGDTGGNAGGEANRLYRVKEPNTIPRDHGQNYHLPLDSTLMYSWNQHDCETLMVDNRGEIYLVSKRHNAHGYVFHVPKEAWGTHQNEYLTGGVHLPLNTGDYGPVGGDISPDGRAVLLKTYGHVYYWDVSDHNYPAAMAHYPQTLPYHGERQGESVCWDKDGKGYFTLSEGSHQSLWYYQKY
ncbi:hypothetical protein FSP39_003062 [Pinctada imbricata]|uniref:Uncharacterized protein n=1 Tax=Pinctada imbricata TaxID=66713 RepID=A0AA88XYL0_PINIB|nr:hypothetical protein FSP39_003062 [Pinctada imbricata]